MAGEQSASRNPATRHTMTATLSSHFGWTRSHLQGAWLALASATLFVSMPGATFAGSRIQFVDSGQRLIGTTNGLEVALGDLDGDGDLDAVVANRPTQIWINQGGAQAGTPGTFLESDQRLDTAGLFGRSVEVADLDQDGDLDIFLAQSDSL